MYPFSDDEIRRYTDVSVEHLRLARARRSFKVWIYVQIAKGLFAVLLILGGMWLFRII